MKNKEKVIIQKRVQSLIKVENFIEEVCEKYNINDNYFGNFVLAVTELFKIVIDKEEESSGDKLILIFETKEENIVFVLKGCTFKEEVIKKFYSVDQENYLIEKEERSIFLIKTLCDEIEFNEDEVAMSFAIEEVTKRKGKLRQKAYSSYLKKKRKAH